MYTGLKHGPTYGIIGTKATALDLFRHAYTEYKKLSREAAANDFYTLAEKYPLIWKLFLEAGPKPKKEAPKCAQHSLATIISETWLFPETHSTPKHPEIKHIDFYA